MVEVGFVMPDRNMAVQRVYLVMLSCRLTVQGVVMSSSVRVAAFTVSTIGWRWREGSILICLV